MRRAFLTAAIVLAVLPSAAQAGYDRPAKYGDTLVPNVAIDMSDGTKLVADVAYPTDPATGQKAAGTFPVLLTQNPYICQTPAGTEVFGGAAGSPGFFADHGYIFVSVCVRGTGRSGGTWGVFSPRDQQDGVELVTWAAHYLDHSNGRVGLIGCSYLGLTQIFTAGVLKPGSPVKAMAPSCAGAEIFRETNSSGGVPTETSEYAFPGALALIGARAQATGAQLFAEGQSGGDVAYYRDFWKFRTPGNYAKQIVRNGIPALLWSGWHDIFSQTSSEMYAYFQNAAAGRPVFGPMAAGQKADPRWQIVVGPWGHGSGIDSSLQLEWFDTWMLGKDTAFRRANRSMHLQDLGTTNTSDNTGKWVNVSDWPVTHRYTQWFLGADGALSPNVGKAGGDQIEYAPPQSGASLTYTSKPLAKGATLAGPLAATLYAATTGTNLNLVVDLLDVAPDGTTTSIGYGSLAGSLRKLVTDRSWTDDAGVAIKPYALLQQDAYLTPAQVARLDVVMTPPVYSIAPGHALRVLLRTQVDPTTDCRAILGNRPCLPTLPQRQTFPGTYTVRRGAGRPSSINLPLLPAGCFAASGGTGAEPDGLSDPGRSCVDG